MKFPIHLLGIPSLRNFFFLTFTLQEILTTLEAGMLEIEIVYLQI